MTSEVSISYQLELSTAPYPESDEYSPLVSVLFFRIQFNIILFLHRIPGGFFHSDFRNMILYAFFPRPCLPMSRFGDRSSNI
jgi:hypothetical protein